MNNHGNKRFIFLSLLAILLCSVPGISPLNAKERVTSTTSKGLKLNANLQLAEGKKLTDGVILLTHGTLAHNEMEIIATLQELLKERGHNSLAINLSLGISDRASASYDCKTPHRHKHWDALLEIDHWVKWLKSKGVSHITLMGHSRGGAQTAAYASTATDPVIKRAILVAPATWSEKGAATGYLKSYKTPLKDLLVRAQKLEDEGKGNEMMENIALIYCNQTSATANSFVSYYKPDPRRHTPSLLPKLKMPVLVIAGANDEVVKGLPDAVKPLADGKKIKFNIVEDADHFFRDFAAEELADLIDEFAKS